MKFENNRHLYFANHFPTMYAICVIHLLRSVLPPYCQVPCFSNKAGQYNDTATGALNEPSNDYYFSKFNSIYGYHDLNVTKI
jgi:hypothetical protein